MEHIISLAENTKSKYLVILGCILSILAIATMIVKLLFNENVFWYDWLHGISLLVLGGTNIALGLGFNLGIFLFGDIWIKITDEGISTKVKLRGNEESVLWEEIEQITIKHNKYFIQKKDSSMFTFSISTLSYNQRQNLKEIIAEKMDSSFITKPR